MGTYVETPTLLINTEYAKWKDYVENGWPKLPADPEEPGSVPSPGHIVIEPTLSGDAAKASVTKEMLNKAFAEVPKVKGVQIVGISIGKLTGANSYELNLPTEFLTKGGKNQRIAVSTEFGTVTMQGHLLTRAKLNGVKTVNVVLSAGPPINNKATLELRIVADGKDIDYNHPGAPVEITIP
ncbi:hypothetical protein ACFVSW_26305 [Neobacillus sp. NPDC058068]|uniref:hypothetical protein n=1 Tax=Neobacillus sp. NPDC058068 TaxID=3346325 RepID=UPI0036D804B3